MFANYFMKNVCKFSTFGRKLRDATIIEVPEVIAGQKEYAEFFDKSFKATKGNKLPANDETIENYIKQWEVNFGDQRPPFENMAIYAQLPTLDAHGDLEFQSKQTDEEAKEDIIMWVVRLYPADLKQVPGISTKYGFFAMDEMLPDDAETYVCFVFSIQDMNQTGWHSLPMPTIMVFNPDQSVNIGSMCFMLPGEPSWYTIDMVYKTLENKYPEYSIGIDERQLFYSSGLAQYSILKICAFMHCRNITLKDCRQSAKVARKKNKPFYEYKILELDDKSKKRYTSNAEPGSSGIKKRLHLCRGHIRTYTEDAPLFGHYVGNVWIPPHRRGDGNLGYIEKDYVLAAS